MDKNLHTAHCTLGGGNSIPPLVAVSQKNLWHTAEDTLPDAVQHLNEEDTHAHVVQSGAADFKNEARKYKKHRSIMETIYDTIYSGAENSKRMEN